MVPGTPRCTTNLRQAVTDLKATKFNRFTDLFLRVNVTPAKVDWFDDDGTAMASPLLLIFGEGARAQAAVQRQRDAERAAATMETGIQPAR